MTLKLEGSLSGPWVDELQKCWGKLNRENVPVEVDLQGLNFLDQKGTSLLLQMEQRGSRLFGSSAFIHDLLKAEAPVQTRPPHKTSRKEN